MQVVAPGQRRKGKLRLHSPPTRVHKHFSSRLKLNSWQTAPRKRGTQPHLKLFAQSITSPTSPAIFLSMALTRHAPRDEQKK